jgi:hypothetical protein
MFNMRYVACMPRYAETVFPVKKVIALSNEMAERIRDYRFTERIESENEAIRRLIEAGLSGSKTSGTSGDGGAGGGSKPHATKSPSPPEKPKPTPRSSQTHAA